MRCLHGIILASVALALSSAARAADPAGAAAKPAAPPSSYVASGLTTDADLVRLREALEKLPAVDQVEIHRGLGGAVVRIRGQATVSLFAATAKKLGFLLRPAPTRFYAAAGQAGEAQMSSLRAAIKEVVGVDQVEVSRTASGAALRVTGVEAPEDLAAAGKSAGFTLRQLGSYAVAGSSTPTDLGRLREALGKVSGVEEVKVQGLKGGATLLVYGDVEDPALTAAAAAAGYAFWPLANPTGPREFKIGGAIPDPGKVREALQRVDEIGSITVRADPGGARLFVDIGLAAVDKITAAAAAAGFPLIPVENVSLPTLTPEVGRTTPPDFEERVVDDPAVVVGAPAPDFELRSPDGGAPIRLSNYRGKPVVLLFGSCT